MPTVTITCSSCGRTDTIAGPDPQHVESLFADWQVGGERPYVDYCPDCSEASGRPPAARRRTARTRRSRTKLVAYRVTLDDGVVERFEVRAQNISTGYFKALSFARNAAGCREIARIELEDLDNRRVADE